MYRLVVAALFACLLCGQTKQSPEDLLRQAVEFHQEGKLAEAIHDYEQFLDLVPDAPNVRSNLGAALVASGKFQEAIDQYNLALLKEPNPAVRLNLALAYYKTANYGEAAKQLEQVRAAMPDNYQATLLLADCDVRSGENKKTIALLTPLRAAHQDDLGIAYILGTALARDGQADQAGQVIDAITARGDSAEARLLIGTTKFAARDFTGSVEDLRKAVELKPDLPDAYTYYGLALFSKGDLEQSRSAFESALKLAPNDFEANLHVGLMQRQEEKYAEARKSLDRALNARPGNLAVRYQIALIDMAQSRDLQAGEALEQIVKEAPEFTEAHVSLSIIYFREHRKEDGNKERAIVQKLNAVRQAEQPGAKIAGETETKAN